MAQFGGLEAIVTGISDEFPKSVGKHRELFVLCLLSFSFLLSLSTTTFGGIYIVTLMETYAAGTAIMTVVLLEAIAVSWYYGTSLSRSRFRHASIFDPTLSGIDRLSHDIRSMIRTSPGIYWTVCWKYLSPLFLIVSLSLSLTFPPQPSFSPQFMIVMSFLSTPELSHGSYRFPDWSKGVGWAITMSSLSLVPAYALYRTVTKRRKRRWVSARWRSRALNHDRAPSFRKVARADHRHAGEFMWRGVHVTMPTSISRHKVGSRAPGLRRFLVWSGDSVFLFPFVWWSKNKNKNCSEERLTSLNKWTTFTERNSSSSWEGRVCWTWRTDSIFRSSSSKLPLQSLCPVSWCFCFCFERKDLRDPWSSSLSTALNFPSS